MHARHVDLMNVGQLFITANDQNLLTITQAET